MTNEMIYDMKSFKFTKGEHESRQQGMCLMEAVAYIAGEPHSDHPKCASPVITEIAINLNDEAENDEERQRILSPILWRIPGTRDNELEPLRIEKYYDLLRVLKELGELIYYNEISHLSFLDIHDYTYLYYGDVPIDTLYFRKDRWKEFIQPSFLKLIDELINMTEIKEIVPNSAVSANAVGVSRGK